MRSLVLSLLLAAVPSVALAGNIQVQGTLFSGGTWDSSNTYTLTGDVTVPTGQTLTIGAGTQITAASSDGMISGTNTAKVELIVQGTLQVNGTTGSPVVFNCTSSTPGCWVGIEISGSGSVITGASITAASTGVSTSQGVSLTHSMLSGNSTGFLLTGGTATLSNDTVSGNSSGIIGTGGTLNVDHSLVTSNSSYGIEMNGATGLLSHNTIVTNGYGVYFVGTSPYTSSGAGSETIRDSVITANTSYGVYVSGSDYNTAAPCDHDDIWGNGSGGTSNSYNISAGSGELLTNPLFVGGSNYDPTTNSPLRQAGTSGSDIGAFAYNNEPTASLEGTLYTNTTLSGSNTIVGDLAVAPGVTLTLSAGATLTFATSDDMRAGNDTAHCELIVNGTLVVNGTTQNPVTLTGAGSAAGAWTGVELTGAGSTLTGLVISKAATGIYASQSFSLTNSTLTGNSTGANVSGGTETISHVTVSGNSSGIIGTGGTLNVDHALVTGNSSYGIEMNGATGLLSHNTIVTNGYGVYFVGTSPYTSSGAGSETIRDSVITNNTSYGVYVSGSDYNTAAPCDHDDIWGNGSGGTSNSYNISAGSGELLTNPLFVGGSNYDPTTNSPLRQAGTSSSDIGAFAYNNEPTASLEGTLYSNTTLTGSNTIVGDLAVASGVTLTLSAGATLTFATSDDMRAGNDTAHCELIVNGTLVVNGTTQNPVTLTGAGSAAGAWTGVEITGAGSTLTGLVISKAATGIYASQSFSLTNSTLTGNSTGANVSGGTATMSFLTVNGNSSGIIGTGGTLNVDHSLITSNSSYGIEMNGATGLLSHNTIVTNGYGVYFVGTSPYTSSGAGSETIRDSIITNNTSYGIYVSGSDYNTAAPCDHDDIWTNGSGGTSNTYNISAGAGEISSNPLYNNASSGDYHLTTNSPCRMAGTSSSDMGAFPYQVGAVDHIVVTPGSTTVSVNGTVGFSAQAYDVSNTPVNSVTFTWTSSIGSINSSGVLTTGCAAGNGTVTASASGINGNASVTVQAGGIDHIVLTPSSANVNAGGSQAFSASAKDSCNNTVSASFTWSVASGAGSIGSTGSYTAPCTPGSYASAVTVTSGSVSAHADVSVSVGALATLSVSPTNPTVPAGSTQQFTANGADACGNGVTASPSWSVVNGGGSISSSGLFTAGSSAGTFANTIQASANGITATTGVTIAAGSVASLVVSPANATIGIGQHQTFTVTASDSSGNSINVTPTWSVINGGGTIDASTGIFTAGNVSGTFNGTVQASAGGITATATVSVLPGATASIFVNPTTATLAPNGTTTFSAQTVDAHGNATTDTVTWTADPSAGTVTSGGVFHAGSNAGSYPNAVTASVGSLSASASVTISQTALSQLNLLPASTSVRAGGTIAFSVTGVDVDGNTVTVSPTWTILHGGGTIDSNGVFTAGTAPGTFVDTVQASANGLSATSTVVVTAGPVVAVSVSPAHPTLQPGGTQLFTATASDAYGNTVAGSARTWSADPAAGTIDAAGNFTAGSIPGDFASAVSVTVDGIVGTASVQVAAPSTTGTTGTTTTTTTGTTGTTTTSTTGTTGTTTTTGTDSGTTTSGSTGTTGTDSGTTDTGGDTATTGGSGSSGQATTGSRSVTGKGCGSASGNDLLPLLALGLFIVRRRRV